ncbi:MAG: spermidine synthase [Oryzomonas sp.]|uniref:spermidine synthase n=1 Tax=Oryzomonas sp. TaxID=2855186 RepID=UPI00284BC43D|nr:spermidine synthase [Oryzomonas sp.]MDR3579275.1 spermidine synthase [Oryzomonas sp.]
MIPWELIDSAQAPGGGELRLYRRGREYSIQVDGNELMNSRVHSSEEALADLACARIADRPFPRILIGGMGMGYTTAAALHRLGANGRVVVAELVPSVVEWNRGPLADLAGYPLDDCRVTVQEKDVAIVLRSEKKAYDAILLDVDNGPEAMTRRGNAWLYGKAGLEAAFAALRPAGVLAVWSAGPDRAFTERLRLAGFGISEVRVPARGKEQGGRQHTIWLAARNP